MVLDTLFHSERNKLKKIALLLTIPCAIFPILAAVSGMMTAFSSPLIFKYDYWLFGLIYCFYTAGLFFSWRAHKKIYPFLIFLVHLSSVFYYSWKNDPDWMPYVAIVTIILTSLINQYYRVGSFECQECENLSYDK